MCEMVLPHFRRQHQMGAKHDASSRRSVRAKNRDSCFVIQQPLRNCLISPMLKGSGPQLPANRSITDLAFKSVNRFLTSSRTADSPRTLSRARRRAKPERKLWDAQLANLTFVVEASNADIKRCHRDLPVRRGRGAEKIDRADNFLQQALQIAFPDFDRVANDISRQMSIW